MIDYLCYVKKQYSKEKEYNDLSDFSDELQNEVKRILEMSR